MKVGEEGQKDLTITYLIVQMRVIALLFSWFCLKKFPIDRSVSFLQPALPSSVCCSYVFVLAFCGSAGTLQNFLMGGLKIAAAGSVWLIHAAVSHSAVP